MRRASNSPDVRNGGRVENAEDDKQMLAGGQFRGLVTTALFLEYETVLNRPGQREAHGPETGEVDLPLNELVAFLEPVDVRFTWGGLGLRTLPMNWSWRRP